MYRPTHISASDPTVNDDYADGYRNGNFWLNSATDTLFCLKDHTTGAAAWVESTGAAISDWANWTPTFIWTGNTPVGITYVARYIVVGNKVNFTLDVDATAGAVGVLTNMECTLPVTPIDLDNYIPIVAQELIDGTYTRTNIAYVDGTQAVDANRKLYHVHFANVQVDDAFRLFYEGFYEQKV